MLISRGLLQLTSLIPTTKKRIWSLLMEPVKPRINTHKHSHSSAICFRKAHSEWKGCHRVNVKLNEAQQMCVRTVCVDFGKHKCECAGCLDQANSPHVKQLCWYSMFLRSELTTHRAGAFGKPAGPGPCLRNPKTSRHNRSLRSPNGPQRDLRQAPTPEETISVFTKKRKSERQRGERREIFKVYSSLSCYKNNNPHWIPH